MLEFSPTAIASEAITRMLSPYQFNPTNYHPLRSVVEEMFDMDAVCSEHGPTLFVNPTNARDYLTRQSHQACQEAVDAYWNLGDSLWNKYDERW